jgi:hypothetical protein
MKFLLALTCSNGLTYACGPGCYNGTSSLGDCVCGGINRGVGRPIAAQNVRASFKAMAARWQEKHPEIEITAIDIMGCVPTKTDGRRY